MHRNCHLLWFKIIVVYLSTAIGLIVFISSNYSSTQHNSSSCSVRNMSTAEWSGRWQQCTSNDDHQRVTDVHSRDARFTGFRSYRDILLDLAVLTIRCDFFSPVIRRLEHKTFENGRVTQENLLSKARFASHFLNKSFQCDSEYANMRNIGCFVLLRRVFSRLSFSYS